MKRIIAVILAFVFVLGIFSSCGSNEPVVLYFAVGNTAGSFDPQVVGDATATIVVRNCFEGLINEDENGNISEGVARDWKISEDGLTYTFYLRDDAKWHLTSNAQKQLEGKLPENFDLSVTAYDFQFALRRTADPNTKSPMAYMVYNIENAPEILSGEKAVEELGVRVIDKTTLEIKLKLPQSNFLNMLAQPFAMPCNKTFFEACMGRYGKLIKFSLSNGPFYLSRFDDSSYRINKDSDYWNSSEVVPDYVWLYKLDSDEEIIEKLETDDYSGAVIDEEVYTKLKVNKNMTVAESPNKTVGLIFNIEDPVLSDVNIRNAFTSATDVNLICENAGKNRAQGCVPKSAASQVNASQPIIYDELAADEFLAEGFKTLEVNNIELSILCEKKYEDIMKKLLQEWQKVLGISVTLSVKAVTYQELVSSVLSKNYQIALFPYEAQADSVFEYFGMFTKFSPLNITGFDDERLMPLLASMYSSDKNKEKEAYEQIENMIYESGVFVPLWNSSSYFVCTKYVRGVKYFSGRDKLYFKKATNVKQ